MRYLRSCLFRAAPKRTEEEMMKREKEGLREREEMEAMSKRKKTRGEKCSTAHIICYVDCPNFYSAMCTSSISVQVNTWMAWY